MATAQDLEKELRRIDGRGYKAYRDIEGEYGFEGFTVMVEHVQGDPFAAPSNIIIKVPMSGAAFPEDTFSTKSRRVALRDFLTRRFHSSTRKVARGNRGTGKSGLIAIDAPGQEVLERTSVFVNEREVEARIRMGLPAFGRKVAGRHAREMFTGELPEIVRRSLFYGSLDSVALYRHIEAAEDAGFLRGKLAELNLVSFVADGAALPRRSGIDPRPLGGENVVPFTSPETLRVEVELPNRGRVAGMGVPRGITLIVGGGYHGKSTLLNAIELGVYNHVPGDGRELVVTDPDAVKIRAEDGRGITGVDISPFIGALPFGGSTVDFSTENASGSTSQAANIMEALEAGAATLLIDEDTSATNFMVRDHRMQELVSKETEPITPFIDKARQLHRDHGVSIMIVMGGSGDYFDVADLVVCMVDYRPSDVTGEAKAIAERYASERKAEGGESFGTVTERAPLAGSLDPSRGKKDVKIAARGVRSIGFGREDVELGSVEQLVDESQTRAIGEAMNYARKYMDGSRSLEEVIEMVLKDVDERGLDVLSPLPVGNFARFRGVELAGAINRLRTLRVKQRRG